MTAKDKAEFDKKIEIYYDHTVMKLGTKKLMEKYDMSEDMIRVYLNLAAENHKILRRVLEKRGRLIGGLWNSMNSMHSTQAIPKKEDK